MRIIKNIEEARNTVLKRAPIGELQIPQVVRKRIREIFGRGISPASLVARIIRDVRREGDKALLYYTKLIDGTELESLRVDMGGRKKILNKVPSEVKSALALAAKRIENYHLQQLPRSWINFNEGGTGNIFKPINRAGIYVPGGSASYPSTVLMTVIPARIAGVRHIVLCTPAGQNGKVSDITLAAAAIVGIEDVFCVGGAQAIAAMAYGTETVPGVDKVYGPGNIFVLLAKKQVFGDVGIDGLHGPTETIVIADSSADPALCAADLLAQAEHDVMASAILMTGSTNLARRVSREVEKLLSGLDRRDVAEMSLLNRGGIIVVNSIEQAIGLVNEYAPEHLELIVRDAWKYIGMIENAGGIFLGENSPESLADYIAGPSHVMPTGGSARFSSALSVYDFLKVVPVVSANRKTLEEIAASAAIIARQEGLTAHANALDIRIKKNCEIDSLRSQ